MPGPDDSNLTVGELLDALKDVPREFNVFLLTGTRIDPVENNISHILQMGMNCIYINQGGWSASARFFRDNVYKHLWDWDDKPKSDV